MTPITTHSVDDIMRPETRARLVELAKELKREPADLLDDTLGVIEHRRRYLAAIDEGLADIEAGRVVDGEAVDSWLATWGTADESQNP